MPSKKPLAAAKELSTKIHATCDALGSPTALHLTTGQAHDLEGADVLLSTLEAEIVLVDKAYDADERMREVLEAQGKQAVISSKSNCTKPLPYDRQLYQARHLIKNFFTKLKHYRAIATRYDKRAVNFLGAIYLAAAIIWLTTESAQ